MIDCIILLSSHSKSKEYLTSPSKKVQCEIVDKNALLPLCRTHINKNDNRNNLKLTVYNQDPRKQNSKEKLIKRKTTNTNRNRSRHSIKKQLYLSTNKKIPCSSVKKHKQNRASNDFSRQQRYKLKSIKNTKSSGACKKTMLVLHRIPKNSNDNKSNK